MVELVQIAMGVIVAMVVAFGAGRFSGHSAARRAEQKQRLDAHVEMGRYTRDAETQDDDALAERITRGGV